MFFAMNFIYAGNFIDDLQVISPLSHLHLREGNCT